MKTYYLVSFILRKGDTFRTFMMENGFGGIRAEGKEFGSLKEAISVSALRAHAPWRDVQIHKVTETPGTGEVRTLLGETEAAPEGATVKYAVRHTEIRSDRPYYGENDAFGTVEKAKLFSTHGAAIKELALEYTNSCRFFHIDRVAITTSAPTITETVLA